MHPEGTKAGGSLPPYAGSVRGQAGFYRVGRDVDGRWWIVDPTGAEVFVRAVHGVGPTPPQVDAGLPRDVAVQLRSWGFNAVGGNSAVGGDDGLPFMAVVDFCKEGPVMVAPGLRLPDVFDAEWPRRAQLRALAVCGPLGAQPALLGWMTDDTLAWAQRPEGARPSLLQHCLSLEPSFAAYHAAWEFVLALHGGRLEALAKAWNLTLGNKEVLRDLTRQETGITSRGYGRDNARWSKEFARRYFTVTSAAIRAADPNHLVFGCRFRRAEGADVQGECCYPAVDVSLLDWRELPPVGAPAGLQPVLAGEVNWADEEFLRAPMRGSLARLTTVERMLRRARSVMERMARHPGVVGYTWGQWQDEPGEQPPFARGVIHANGAEAREHTELLTQFNLRADALHRSPSPWSPIA